MQLVVHIYKYKNTAKTGTNQVIQRRKIHDQARSITKPVTLAGERPESPIDDDMPWFPAVPPALAAADGAARIKKRAGLPKLLHKLFVKVLCLRPASAAAGQEYYGAYGMGADEDYCYYYSYGGAGSSWAGVLSSIPEEDGDSSGSDSDSEAGTPDASVVPGPAVLRKAKSERFVHVEVLL